MVIVTIYLYRQNLQKTSPPNQAPYMTLINPSANTHTTPTNISEREIITMYYKYIWQCSGANGSMCIQTVHHSLICNMIACQILCMLYDMWLSESKCLTIPFKAPVVSLSKTLYPYCLVLVGPRNRCEGIMEDWLKYRQHQNTDSLNIKYRQITLAVL